MGKRTDCCKIGMENLLNGILHLCRIHPVAVDFYHIIGPAQNCIAVFFSKESVPTCKIFCLEELFTLYYNSGGFSFFRQIHISAEIGQMYAEQPFCSLFSIIIQKPDMGISNRITYRGIFIRLVQGKQAGWIAELAGAIDIHYIKGSAEHIGDNLSSHIGTSQGEARNLLHRGNKGRCHECGIYFMLLEIGKKL